MFIHIFFYKSVGLKIGSGIVSESLLSEIPIWRKISGILNFQQSSPASSCELNGCVHILLELPVTTIIDECPDYPPTQLPPSPPHLIWIWRPGAFPAHRNRIDIWPGSSLVGMDDQCFGSVVTESGSGSRPRFFMTKCYKNLQLGMDDQCFGSAVTESGSGWSGSRPRFFMTKCYKNLQLEIFW